jgi:histidine ammonia-lyase
MLGKQVKDKITGFSGIAIGRAEYLYGCIQYGIAPFIKADGTVGDTCWFDQGRIEVIGEGITAQEVKAERPGGPNRDHP